ncbi:MAG: DNA polymerase Y family protein, partial [Caulobacteraceae bacterium]
MERTLCAWSPLWAIANWRRRNPSAARGEAFALLATSRGVRRLAAVDAGAAAMGLFAGQKAADAAALAPDLVTADAAPEADAAALVALCDWCARFSPAVSPDPPDGFFLDIAGIAHLWGGEAAMAADLAARLARGGIPVRVAVAGSAGAAWALAHFGPDRTIVGPGEAAPALAPLPVAALRLEARTAAQIARLGLTTVGRLAAVPREGLLRRFGREPVLRLDQAMGKAAEALVFRRPPTPWLARLAFAEAVSAPEDLARVTTDICRILCARLEDEVMGARRFELCFHRVDGAASRLAVGLALPGREAAAVVRLFAPRLETVDPGFGVEVVTLAAMAVEPLSRCQRRLDDAGETAPEDAIAPLVDRLTNRLGEGAVWRADAFPSH